jgi:hypothetical protein
MKNPYLIIHKTRITMNHFDGLIAASWRALHLGLTATVPHGWANGGYGSVALGPGA